MQDSNLRIHPQRVTCYRYTNVLLTKWELFILCHQAETHWPWVEPSLAFCLRHPFQARCRSPWNAEHPHKAATITLGFYTVSTVERSGTRQNQTAVFWHVVRRFIAKLSFRKGGIVLAKYLLYCSSNEKNYTFFYLPTSRLAIIN